MARTIVFCPTSDADERRWLSAVGIARQLPRDRFEVRILGAFDPAEVDRPNRPLLLADSNDAAACAQLIEASQRGIATALVVVDPTRPSRAPIGIPNVLLVESRWSADFLGKVHGVKAQVLSPFGLRPTLQPGRCEPRYAAFIDPVPEHGVDLFVRLADELGRRRPDIPLLVVEGRGTEADLVARGIDLRAHGNVHLMSRPTELDQVWSVARLVLAPLLDPWVGGVLADAANAGIPIMMGDHPALREILGPCATALPMPSGMTPCYRRVPEVIEIEPWIDAVVRCWDTPREGPLRGDRHADRVRPEPMRGAEAATVLAAVPRANGPRLAGASASRGEWAVLVPFMDTIEPDCETALRELEQAGVRVVRCRGSSAIDHARSILASESLRRGAHSILFIDADIAFESIDALRLFARPEPVVAGIYTKKNVPALSSSFLPGQASVVFGAASPGLYPLKYAAAGFLRIRTDVLRLLIERLALPLCNTHTGEGFWPFFLPLVLLQRDGSHRYLAEDWAFSHRLSQIGVTPLADTTIRLSHLGRHGYTWEDTLRGRARYDSFTFNFSENEESS